MSIKYNEFGEVISVNGLTTGQHLGKPMQDAIAERPEDNEAYGTQRRTVGRMKNIVEDQQPKPSGGGGITTAVIRIIENDGGRSYELAKGSYAEIKSAMMSGEPVACYRQILSADSIDCMPIHMHYLVDADVLFAGDSNTDYTIFPDNTVEPD